MVENIKKVKSDLALDGPVCSPSRRHGGAPKIAIIINIAGVALAAIGIAAIMATVPVIVCSPVGTLPIVIALTVIFVASTATSIPACTISTTRIVCHYTD